ncbi:MAG TPA: hypothetical protein VFQ61_16685, partial [Polyangiaceae bacterium]|nr:hypothetical protein [Polyangiaceae bacterium]
PLRVARTRRELEFSAGYSEVALDVARRGGLVCEQMRRFERPMVWLRVCVAVALAVFVWGMLGREPYDDSYFFKRVAVNFIRPGAWPGTSTRAPYTD